MHYVHTLKLTGALFRILSSEDPQYLQIKQLVRLLVNIYFHSKEYLFYKKNNLKSMKKYLIIEILKHHWQNVDILQRFILLKYS